MLTKQALKKHWGEKIAIATANFIMVQVFIEGLKSDIKNEMIKKSWLSLADTFDRAEELEKHAEQKALAAAKINETSVDYMGSSHPRGNSNTQRGQFKGRGGKPQYQQRGNTSAATTTKNFQTSSSTKPLRGYSSYRGNYQRGRGNFPSSKGVT
jgi:hypothetical protein